MWSCVVLWVPINSLCFHQFFTSAIQSKPLSWYYYVFICWANFEFKRLCLILYKKKKEKYFVFCFESMPKMYYIPLLSGISGLTFDPSFLSCFSASFSCSSCLVIFLLMLHAPCFLQNIFWHFVKTVRVGLFRKALVKQLGDNSWYVQLSAIWHWYLLLYI